MEPSHQPSGNPLTETPGGLPMASVETTETVPLRSAAFGCACAAAVFSVEARSDQTAADTTCLDVTHIAVKAGFLVPVTVSPQLWRDLCAIPEDSTQDVYDRLCDVFFMARWMIAKEPILAIRELTFTLPLPIKGNEEYEEYGIRLVTADADRGEAGITLFWQGEP